MIRKNSLFAWATALGLCGGCASGGAGAEVRHPEGGPSLAGGAPAVGGSGGEEGTPQALPKYLTLRLNGPEVSVGGRVLSSAELTDAIRTEVSNPAISGAAIYLGKEFSGEMLGALVWELSTAGLTHIVISDAQLDAPVDDESEQAMAPGSGEREEFAPVQPAPASPSVAEERTDESATSTAPSAAAEGDPLLEIKPIGLHVGGGPNDDATKALFGDPLAATFEALRKCHGLAINRERKASVGVDLKINAGGGKPKVQDFRSAIKGDEFRECVVKTFSGVHFPEPPRPTVISYSVLFKPGGR